MQYNSEEIDEILRIYNSESEEIIQELNDEFLLLEKNPNDKTPLKKLFQLAHSLKGASRMIGFNSVQNIAHKLEDILSFWIKDDVVINVDMFEEIYNVCDFLLELIHKSVDIKTDYNDKKVTVFINKLDNFIAYNRMLNEKQETKINDDFLSSKTVDINAIILELMFILEMDFNKQNIEDIISVIGDNLLKLNEIFIKTEYSDIKQELNELTEYINNNKNKEFDFLTYKSKIINLRNSIYNLFKKLNINAKITKNFPEIRKTEITDKKEYTDKTNNQLKEKINIIELNLEKAKSEIDKIKVVTENIDELKNLTDGKIPEAIFSKIKDLLSLIEQNKKTVSNDCYLVLLQCINTIKQILLEKKEKNQGNIDLLIQRLCLVEDMYKLLLNSDKEKTEDNEKNSLISVSQYNNFKKSIKSVDLGEIKVLRVDSDKIDNLISQCGELLINGIKTKEHLLMLSQANLKLSKLGSVSKKIINYLKYLEKKGFFLSSDDINIQAFYKKTQTFYSETNDMINELGTDFNNLYNIISEDDNKLHQNVMGIETISKSIRVLPLAAIFHSFPRMIRDIAKEKNKKVDFIISGSDTTVDKKIIEEIKMPLIHILRNAIAHGIEEPEVRINNNKKEIGCVKLTAKQVENNVIITIEDDGYGINYEKIKSTAIKKGLLLKEEADNISQEQLMKLLFLPGFSTTDSISEISGRGIGLDIVKTKISALNGELTIDSELNKGCRVNIKLPVSMSTLKTFILLVNEQKYAIPVNSIKYVKNIKKDEIFRKNGLNCILFENHSIPVYSLSEIFNENNNVISDKNVYTVIIIENQNKQTAFIVDKLLGDQEVFHKKLVPPVINIKNISGFTTLSTGEICLIINPYELMRNAGKTDNNALFEIQNYSIQDKTELLKGKKILILNDESKFLNNIKTDLSGRVNFITEFGDINSIYDYINKNDTDILILKLNPNEDNTINLIKYLKSDENYNNIKLVIFSENSEYELHELLNEYKYDLYFRISEYDKENLINKLSRLN